MVGVRAYTACRPMRILLILFLIVFFMYPVSAFAPLADFTGTPTTGATLLTVTFTDLSANTPTGWAWFFGDEDYSGAWTNVNNSAGWSARNGHTVTVLPDGSLVIMGGEDDLGYMNDVWISNDNGATWTQQTAAAGWTARYVHSSVVMPNGSILLMGGDDGSLKNDVWMSNDKGVTWTQQTAAAGWTARSGHSSVILTDNSIVILGGYDGGTLHDVWRSTDNGVTWIQQTAGAEWTERLGHSCVVLKDDSIVILGGYDGLKRNDVWRSTDTGVTWIEQTAAAKWLGREYFSCIEMPDRSIVIMGGMDSQGNSLNDIWRSTDNGVTWIQVNAGADWMARHCHSGVAMPDGSIVIMGGFDSVRKNDVWRMQPAGSSLQNPSHIYNTTGTYSVALQAFNTVGYNCTRKTDYVTVTGLVAPIVTNATTNTAGTEIIVTFSKVMADPAGKNSQFAYQINGGGDQTFSAAVLDADTRKIVLTCNGTTIAYGNAITINYTAGDVTAGDGGILATFTGQAVMNMMPPQIPVASFTVNITEGNPPLAVQFNDTSTNNPTAWNWSFINVTGDNTPQYFSEKHNPEHVFGTGNFSIVLNASNSGGFNISTQTTFINVSKAPPSPPVANFTGTPTEGTAPLQVTFTDSSTAEPTSWLWHFGDGTTNTTRNPVHTYAASGLYTVNLTATNAGGSNTTERFNYINVTPSQPTVSSATTNTAGSQITVTFSKAMADPAGKHGQFAYQINGGSDQTFSTAVPDADTKKFILTCNGTAIAYGNVITINYTAGDVTAGDGRILATFTGQAVTNMMPAPAPPSNGGGSVPAPATPPVQPAAPETPVETPPEEPADVPQEILSEEKAEIPPELPMEAPVIDMTESFSEDISSSINKLKSSLRSGGRDSSGTPLHIYIPVPADSIIPHDVAPVAAVATGVMASAGAASLAGFFSGGGGGAGSSFGSGWFSSFLKRLGNIVSEFIGEEALELYGERNTFEKPGSKKAGGRLIPGMTRNNLIVILSGAIIYAAAFMFADRIGLDPILILVYLLIVGIALVAHELAHMMIARKYAIESAIRIYPAGTIASIVTGVFFGNVFGQPLHMKVMENESHTETEKGLTMLAGPGVNILLGTVFLFMIPVGGIWLMIGRLGFIANMIEGLFSMIPCRPMDGKSIKKWNAIIWAGLFIPWILLYFILYVI